MRGSMVKTLAHQTRTVHLQKEWCKLLNILLVAGILITLSLIGVRVKTGERNHVELERRK